MGTVDMLSTSPMDVIVVRKKGVSFGSFYREYFYILSPSKALGFAGAYIMFHALGSLLHAKNALLLKPNIH